MGDVCRNCLQHVNFVIGEDSYVCPDCGACNEDIFSYMPPYEKEPQRLVNKNGNFKRGKRTNGPYKELYVRRYHISERLTLLRCEAPPVPPEVQEKIIEEYWRGFWRGEYPRREKLLAGTIRQLYSRAEDAEFKDENGKIIYRRCRTWMERWRQTLRDMRGWDTLDIPSEEFLIELQRKFEVLESNFELMNIRREMPDSKLVKRDPETGSYQKTKKERKNMLNFNECFCQLLLMMGAWQLVPNFPHLKTPVRRDVFIRNYRKIADRLGWPVFPLITVVNIT